MQILETNANLKFSFLFYPTATRRTGSFNQGISSENNYLILLKVCLDLYIKTKCLCKTANLYFSAIWVYSGTLL